MVDAYSLLKKYFFTPIDALMLSISRNNSITLVTFDSWLLSFDKKITKVISPKEILSLR